MRYSGLFLLVITVFFFVSARGQQNKQAVISGILKDAQTKSPLTEAVITISSNAFTGQKFALTDSAGMYKVANLPAGNYTVSFEMEGYEKFMQNSITLKEGTTMDLDYEMIRAKKKNRKSQAQVTSYKR